MGEKYVQEEFLGEESLGEKSVQEEFLGEESLGEKYMGEKYVQEKKLGEESLCEKYMGEKSVQEEFLGEKSLGEKYMGEMYWVFGWKVWWKIAVDGMLAFVSPFSGLILSQLPGTIPSSRAGNPCWTNFFWASLPAVLRMFDNWTQAEAPRGHGWDSMGPALNLRKDNCNSGNWVADGTLLEFCPSFLDFSTVSTFIIFSMDQPEYITQ